MKLHIPKDRLFVKACVGTFVVYAFMIYSIIAKVTPILTFLMAFWSIILTANAFVVILVYSKREEAKRNKDRGT